jgi:HK97 family phage major capsid protein
MKPTPTVATQKPDAAALAAFRKLDTAAQVKTLLGTKVERTFTVEREGLDEEKRTAWLSIASEEPYERWWGIEILSVKKGAIREGRLKAGAPLLVGHDTADQVGVVESYEISPDRKLRVLARFGRSARAEEIWQDVLDGIRRNTSVGYIIHDLVLEKSEEGVNTYRVTSWEPLEGSLVPVPADHTVGVGRALESIQQPERNAVMQKTPEQLEAERVANEAAQRAQEQAVAAAVQRETERVNGLLAAGAEFSDLGGVEIARNLIKDPKATIEGFKLQMLEKMRGTHKPTPTGEPAPQPHGSGARVLLRHGQKLRAFRQPLVYSDGTKMDPLECAYRSGQWMLATLGQSQKAARWCAERGINVEHRVMTTDSGPLGGYLVPDEMEQSIIDLREEYGLARRLARRRPMSSDTKSVPKRTGGVTAYFVNEDNAGVTASDKGWGNVNFVAKTLAALSLISQNLEEDAIIDVVDDLAMEQAYAFAQKEDQCWLIGDGTSTYGGMQGLLTMFNATAYASRIEAASGHDTFAEYDNVDLSAVMAGVADFPGLNPSWLCSKTFAENVFGRLKRSAGGNSGEDLDRRYRYGYGGYPADTSEIMPKVGTSDVTTVEALFGDFSKSSSFGDRRGIMVQVLRERYAEKLQIGVLAHERFHIVNHDLGTTDVKGPVAALKGH